MVERLKLNLLRDSQRIVYLDAEVSDGAFELRVAEQNLDCTEIARLLVNLGCLSSSHCVGAIFGGIQPD